MLQFGLLNKCEDDISLISSFFSTMFETGCDFTNGFQALSLVLLPGLSSHEESRERFIDQIVTECAALEEIVKSHQPQINPRSVRTPYSSNLVTLSQLLLTNVSMWLYCNVSCLHNISQCIASVVIYGDARFILELYLIVI